MNKQRRIIIADSITRLDNVINTVRTIRDDEEMAKENLEEYPQFEMKAMDMEMAVDSMDEAITNIEEAIENLRESVK